jgi:hypothetical protein
MSSTRFRKPFRIFAISLLATLLLIVLTSAILSLFYEKTMIRFMKKYLDEHLLTQLYMDDIRFRVLKGFPNATVEITNAVLLSGKDFSREDFSGSFADTLLQANSILFQFDLLKLVNKEYELKKIELSNGKVNVLFDRQNRHNMDIWKESEVSGQKYSIDLRSIVLSTININLIALREQFALNARSEKTNFRGTLSGNMLSGETRGNFLLHTVALNKKKLVKNASLQLELKMIVSGNRIRISQGKIQLNKAVATLAGEYKGGKGSSIDLTLDMPRFGLAELMSLMPFDQKSLTGNYQFTGNGKLNLAIKGSFGNRKGLLIKSGFELINCKARNTHTRTDIDNINLHGTISGTNTENFVLELNQINAKLGKGTLAGNFSLRNLNTLLFQVTAHAILDLKPLKDFAGFDTLENVTGIIRSDFIAAGSLKRLSADSAGYRLNFLKSGTFEFEDAGIKLKNLPIALDHISGKAKLDNAISLDSVSLRINETGLLINGNIQHLTAYLLKKGILESNLEIITDNLDISKYLNQPVESKSSGGYKSLSLFPANIYLKAHVKAKNFIAGKFKAYDLSLNMFSLKDSLYIDNFFLNFPDGSITGNALISGNTKNHQYSITCNAQPQKINIQQLFYAFNNFTQHFIMDKNMKGLLSGKVSFFAQWDSALKFIPQSMKAKGDFEITNGELVQFEPMLKLSKYINVEELRQIKFKTLKNTIFISNRLVTIPEMAINSTAFNISASGQHSFDNVFDYRLKVLLSDVLFNKARKKKHEIDEFLIEENRTDQTTIPLIIAGTPDKFDVRFDRKRAFNLTRSNMKSNAVPGETIPDPGNFKIEWEEPVQKSKETKPVTKKDQPDFIIEWNEE